MDCMFWLFVYGFDNGLPTINVMNTIQMIVWSKHVEGL